MGVLGFRAGKTPCLRIWIRHICTYQIHWSVRAPSLFLQMSKPAIYSLDTACMNLVCHSPCPSCCNSLPPLSDTDSQWLSLTDSPAVPMERIRIGTPTKRPTVLKGVPDILLGSLFLQKEPEAQGRLCALLCWLGVGQCSHPIASFFFLPSKCSLSWSLWCRGSASASLPCARTLWVVLACSCEGELN